jgi:hypothetical protein
MLRYGFVGLGNLGGTSRPIWRAADSMSAVFDLDRGAADLALGAGAHGRPRSPSSRQAATA